MGGVIWARGSSLGWSILLRNVTSDSLELK